MFKLTVVCFVASLGTVAYGYPAVNDIADFDTIQRLNRQGKSISTRSNDANLADSQPPTKEKTQGVSNDVPVIKNRPKFDDSEENDEDQVELDYLEPDWDAQGSFEQQEESDRVRRWAGSNSGGYSFGSDDDNYDSHECHHDHHRDHHHRHRHRHEHDSDSGSFPDDSGPDDSWEDQKNVHVHKGTKKPTEDGKENITPTSTEPSVRRTTITAETSTGTTTGRINIDPRFSVQNSGVRNKRMVWNVARPSDVFDENPEKPAKMRWLWDDQKPEVVRTDNSVDDAYVKEQEFTRPIVPVVNLREPCASKFERRDRHGRCRPAFLR